MASAPSLLDGAIIASIDSHVGDERMSATAGPINELSQDSFVATQAPFGNASDDFLRAIQAMVQPPDWMILPEKLAFLALELLSKRDAAFTSRVGDSIDSRLLEGGSAMSWACTAINAAYDSISLQWVEVKGHKGALSATYMSSSGEKVPLELASPRSATPPAAARMASQASPHCLETGTTKLHFRQQLLRHRPKDTPAPSVSEVPRAPRSAASTAAARGPAFRYSQGSVSVTASGGETELAGRQVIGGAEAQKSSSSSVALPPPDRSTEWTRGIAMGDAGATGTRADASGGATEGSSASKASNSTEAVSLLRMERSLLVAAAEVLEARASSFGGGIVRKRGRGKGDDIPALETAADGLAFSTAAGPDLAGAEFAVDGESVGEACWAHPARGTRAEDGGGSFWERVAMNTLQLHAAVMRHRARAVCVEAAR